MAEWGKLTDDEKKVYTANFKVLRFLYPSRVLCMCAQCSVTALCSSALKAFLLHPCWRRFASAAAGEQACSLHLNLQCKTPHDWEVCMQEHAGADEAEALAAAEAEAKEAAQGAAPAATGKILFL